MEDHRDIGRRLGLFHVREDSPGQVFWHPRGFAVWRALEDIVRARMAGLGFGEVRTPQLLARELWERSGHWDKFKANMFVVEDGDRAMALKPMSCPCHVDLFNQRRRSHRELPVRYAEFGSCFRNEPSGALSGVMRTRAFTQDDAHVLCRESDIVGEVSRFVGLLVSLYAELGFRDVGVTLSLRPDTRHGDDALWDRAEGMLREAARKVGLDHVERPGEGAFYGPKLEFSLRDSLGRSWQCGTVQVDFVLPGRLGAEYVDECDVRRVPVMVHHAVLGSMERFIGILLEHHGGALPYALAPEQVAVLPVGAAQDGYAGEVAGLLAASGVRAVRLVDGTLSRRILQAHGEGVPVIAVVGGREAASGSVALRLRDGRKEQADLAGLPAHLRAMAAV